MKEIKKPVKNFTGITQFNNQNSFDYYLANCMPNISIIVHAFCNAI